jgi:hypothetical protein
VSDIKKALTDKFVVQLILSKLEPDGESMSSFRLLDYEEIVPYTKLEQKLTEFYNTGIKKIKEIAEELSNSKKSEFHS